MFLRFTTTPDGDMERNSLHLTDIPVHEMDEDEFISMLDIDEMSYIGAVEVDGCWALELNGLCGFEVDSVDSALQRVAEIDSDPRSVFTSASVGGFAIYEGEYTGDCEDGDIFQPSKLVYKS